MSLDWCQELFVGIKAGERTDELIEQAEAGRPPLTLYLVTLAANGIDQLDIVPAISLRHRLTSQRRLPMIVGLAIGRNEAIEVVGEISRQAYVLDHAEDLRRWFIAKGK
jgi:hypothetical protein